MTAIANAKNLRLYKIRFSLIVEQILTFASRANMVREVKTLSSSFNINNLFSYEYLDQFYR